jgi:hypothetical protein
MKFSTIILTVALALSSTYAMAQSGGNSLDRMAASSATRSAMNSMHHHHHHHHYHHHYHHQGRSSDRYNGNGINDLGVTTNQGRKNNGG